MYIYICIYLFYRYNFRLIAQMFVATSLHIPPKCCYYAVNNKAIDSDGNGKWV